MPPLIPSQARQGMIFESITHQAIPRCRSIVLESPQEQFMRWLIDLHLAALVICTCFSLSDRGLLWSVPLSAMLLPFASALLFPAQVAWLACPLGVLILACRSSRTEHAGGC